MKTDIQIQKDVMDELKWEPSLDVSEIGVAVSHGIVTLGGQVDSYAKKLAAERAAKRVKDVRGIAEDIVVKFGTTALKSDRDIVETVLNTLRWSAFVPDDLITVKVEDGWVTLEGQVNWDYQKKAAVKAIEDKKGVRGIINNLTIKPLVDAPVVKESIKEALERSAEVEADQITVKVDGKTVSLHGKVRSWREKDEVARAAWSAPGVMDVDNKLEVIY